MALCAGFEQFVECSSLSIMHILHHIILADFIQRILSQFQIPNMIEDEAVIFDLASDSNIVVQMLCTAAS